MKRKQRKPARKASQDVVSPKADQQLQNIDLLKRALAWVVTPDIFDGLPVHGNTSWLPVHLVTLAILWVWSDQTCLTTAFGDARRTALTFYESLTLRSYQGFIRALATWNEPVRLLLWSRLQLLMEHCGGKHWRIGEFLALAVDGSRVTVPRTKSNEEAFATKNFGFGGKARRRLKWKNKKRRSKKLGQPVKPQIWLTLIWHIGLKMPWSWRTGPSTSSERGHFLELLQQHVYPKNTLFCADAGFIGYELWKTILDGGHHFLVRVGGNVHLLRKLGRVRVAEDIVYVWPREMQRQMRPPLVARLLSFQGARGPVHLLTSVLNPKRLSLTQARELYKRRWGVELQFRTFKQTFGRGKLRSRTADRALVELDWSLLGLWMIQLFAAKEQAAVAIPPEQSSAAVAISIIRELVRDSHRTTASPRVLTLRLRRAVKDDYQRLKPKRARYRIPFADAPTDSGPLVQTATRKLRQLYHRLAAA
jgi:Transposase DDE domain